MGAANEVLLKIMKTLLPLLQDCFLVSPSPSLFVVSLIDYFGGDIVACVLF
jgi:hypothetical protein